MRTEKVNGKWLLCGVILPKHKIKNGQKWAAASGSGNTVLVVGVRDDWVCYSWKENGKIEYHEKDVFSFQCRYCLVLSTAKIPKKFREE